jgi:glyoxalase family protein
MRAHTIHHVTAVTADYKGNIDFYTRVLGLRLVKKSVNQDDVKAYHLFYADKAGSPGTDMTFFDWPAMGSNVPGLGSVAMTQFLAPAGSLDWWEEHLEKEGAHPDRGMDSLNREAIAFSDPEGQMLALVDGAGVANESSPWSANVPEEFALRGFYGIDIDSARPRDTMMVLTRILGYKPAHASGAILETGDDKSYSVIRLTDSGAQKHGRLGAGGVHHVAFRVADDDELKEMQEKIEATGLRTSGFVNRFYFHSLYFREPGGVLFEMATDGPGFAVDEDADTLGEKLSLPPFLEDQREEIEAGLAGK